MSRSRQHSSAQAPCGDEFNRNRFFIEQQLPVRGDSVVPILVRHIAFMYALFDEISTLQASGVAANKIGRRAVPICSFLLLLIAKYPGLVLSCVLLIAFVAIVGVGRNLTTWAWSSCVFVAHLLGVKCSLGFPLVPPFHFSFTCEARVDGVSPHTPYDSIAPAQLNDLITRISALDSHIHEKNLLLLHRRRDFALRAGGSSVLLGLTSPTYRPQRNSQISQYWNEAWELLRGYDVASVDINPPIVVLEDDICVGSCWAFAGSTGNIGISLAERVFISDITIGYADPVLLSRSESLRAPQSLILWGLVDDAVGNSATEIHQSHCTTDCFSRSPSFPPFPPSVFLPVVEFRYDLNSTQMFQSFPVSQSVQESQTSFQIVVLQVTSNWGSNSTCLYRIGIHGRSATPE
jgi:Sad1 / UNC-like C-terminal